MIKYDINISIDVFRRLSFLRYLDRWVLAITVEATKIRITVVDSEKVASFIDLTHINALRRGVIVIGNK